MKNPRKPSYAERVILASWGLTPMEWGIEKIIKNTLVLRKHLTHEVKEIPNRLKEIDDGNERVNF